VANQTQWRIQTEEQQHAQQTNGTATRGPPNTSQKTLVANERIEMIIYPPYSDSGSGINA